MGGYGIKCRSLPSADLDLSGMPVYDLDLSKIASLSISGKCQAKQQLPTHGIPQVAVPLLLWRQMVPNVSRRQPKLVDPNPASARIRATNRQTNSCCKTVHRGKSCNRSLVLYVEKNDLQALQGSNILYIVVYL